MNSSITSVDILRDKLNSIGANFAANSSNQKNCDPEQVLIEVLESGEFPESKSLVRFTLALLLSHGSLYHVERIKSSIKTLSPIATAVLGAFALKLKRSGDFRWNVICTFSKKKLGTKPPQWQALKEDEYPIKKKGLDPDFLEFGISCPLIEPESNKKIRPTAALIEENTWFRNRALFGTNMRADTVSVIQLFRPKNPYMLSKLLHCSMDCAYRNWRELAHLQGKTIEISL